PLSAVLRLLLRIARRPRGLDFHDAFFSFSHSIVAKAAQNHEPLRTRRITKEKHIRKMQVPFDFAQGRLSTRARSLRSFALPRDGNLWEASRGAEAAALPR